MTRAGRKRLRYVEQIEDDPIRYKYLNKVLKYHSRAKLKLFLILADDRYIDKKTLMHDGKYPYFTAPLNNLIRELGGSVGTWDRNINLFVSLGLIGKVDTAEVQKHNNLFYQSSMIGKMNLARELGINVDFIKEQNVYYIFPYDEEILKEAECRAKAMFENGFSMKSFSKIFLQRVFRTRVCKFCLF